MTRWTLLLVVVVGVVLAACASAPPSPTQAPAGGAAAPTTAAAAAPSGGQAAAPAAAGQPVRGGTLRAGLDSDLTTMDPHMSTAAVDRQVYQSIYNPLVRLDKDLTLKPELAEKWEYPDPTTLVLTLRKGVKFHDGTDFNAQAVKANFDRMMDPATASPRKSEIASVKEVTVVDPYTVKLTLTAPAAQLLATLSDRAGMMISPAAIQKYGKDLARNPVGTGPFQFVEWVKDDHLTVKKFNDYWEKGADGQPLPYLDGVTYKPVTDGSVRLQTLKTNNLDIINLVAAKDVPSLKGSKDPMYSEVPSLQWQGVYLQNSKPPFDKKEVRQAFAYSLDRDALVKSVLFNAATAIQQPIPPSSWAFDNIAPYTRDVAKAKSLLQTAGMTAAVQFKCMVTNTPEASQIAQVYKEQAAEAGFTLDIELLEFGTLLDRLNKKDYQCAVIGWSGRPDPDGNTYNFFVTGAGNNTESYSNKQVDDLLNKARTEYDQAKRKQIYSDAMKIVVDEVPIAFTYSPAEIKSYTPKLQNYQHVPDGMMRFKEVWLTK